MITWEDNNSPTCVHELSRRVGGRWRGKSRPSETEEGREEGAGAMVGEDADQTTVDKLLQEDAGEVKLALHK